MPVVTRFGVALNGTNFGNGSIPLPPGSYVQPIPNEALWWKYLVGAAGVLALIVVVYTCVRDRNRAAVQAARGAPAVPAAPMVPGDHEMQVLNTDPPPPYEALNTAVEPQPGLAGPEEPNVNTEHGAPGVVVEPQPELAGPNVPDVTNVTDGSPQHDTPGATAES